MTDSENRPHQPSFLKQGGGRSEEVDPSLVAMNLKTDLANTFKTEEQRQRALELIQNGQAANAAEAFTILLQMDTEKGKLFS